MTNSSLTEYSATLSTASTSLTDSILQTDSTLSTLTLSNEQARRIVLLNQGICERPCSSSNIDKFAERVAELGMVQLDSIGILARAHHHILWSRQSAYRPRDFDTLLTQNRQVFEHFSHDAVILPISTYPYWQRQHTRRANRFASNAWSKDMSNTEIQKRILRIIDHKGPMCSRDFNASATPGIVQQGKRNNKQAWSRPPHKHALDYLWLSGDLSVSYRKNFTKYYDLTERVIPSDIRSKQVAEDAQIDWLCRSALKKLGFASASEIQRFWEACDLPEVHAWLNRAKGLINILYEDSRGNEVNAFALADLEETLDTLTEPASRIRILNPFDPVVRDRSRLKRLFGFNYRIEIYTPKAKRQYGYYVYPVLEGSRFIGRIEVKANQETDSLQTLRWWLEPKVRDSAGRRKKLFSELTRLARLANVSFVDDLPPLSIQSAD